MPKGVETTPLRRSTRIAASESPAKPVQVRTRRSSASSEPPTATPGKITRAKRLSLSEEGQSKTEREGTPQRTLRGTAKDAGTPKKEVSTPQRRSKRLNSSSPIKEEPVQEKPTKARTRLVSATEKMEVIKEHEEETKKDSPGTPDVDLKENGEKGEESEEMLSLKYQIEDGNKEDGGNANVKPRLLSLKKGRAPMEDVDEESEEQETPTGKSEEAEHPARKEEDGVAETLEKLDKEINAIINRQGEGEKNKADETEPLVDTCSSQKRTSTELKVILHRMSLSPHREDSRQGAEANTSQKLDASASEIIEIVTPPESEKGESVAKDDEGENDKSEVKTTEDGPEVENTESGTQDEREKTEPVRLNESNDKLDVAAKTMSPQKGANIIDGSDGSFRLDLNLSALNSTRENTDLRDDSFGSSKSEKENLLPNSDPNDKKSPMKRKSIGTSKLSQVVSENYYEPMEVDESVNCSLTQPILEKSCATEDEERLLLSPRATKTNPEENGEDGKDADNINRDEKSETSEEEEQRTTEAEKNGDELSRSTRTERKKESPKPAASTPDAKINEENITKRKAIPQEVCEESEEKEEKQMHSSTPAKDRIDLQKSKSLSDKEDSESSKTSRESMRNSPKLQNVESEIDRLIEKNGAEFSDSENESSVFILDEAEEGEEDTPSEDSNQIVDEGESINTTSSEYGSTDDYENDSFVTDDEAEKNLLSGEEYDIYDVEDGKKRKRSRIVRPTESDEEVEAEPKKDPSEDKPKGSPQHQKKSRIIRPTDSSDEETAATVEDNNVSLSKTEDVPLVSANDQTENENRRSLSLLQDVSIEKIDSQKLIGQLSVTVDSFLSELKEDLSNVKINLSLNLDCSGASYKAAEEALQANNSVTEKVKAGTSASLSTPKSKEGKIVLDKDDIVNGLETEEQEETGSVLTPHKEIAQTPSSPSSTKKKRKKEGRTKERESGQLMNTTFTLLRATPEKKKKIEGNQSDVERENEDKILKKKAKNISQNEISEDVVEENAVISKKQLRKRRQEGANQEPETKKIKSVHVETTTAGEVIIESCPKTRDLTQNTVPKRLKVTSKQALKDNSVRSAKIIPSKRGCVMEDFKVEYFPDNLLSKVLEQEEKKKKSRRPSLIPTTTGDGQSEWEIEPVSSVQPSKSSVLTDVAKFKGKKSKVKAVRNVKTIDLNTKDFKNKVLYDPTHVKRMDTKVLIKKKLLN